MPDDRISASSTGTLPLSKQPLSYPLSTKSLVLCSTGFSLTIIINMAVRNISSASELDGLVKKQKAVVVDCK
jgi:hypothetical protein